MQCNTKLAGGRAGENYLRLCFIVSESMMERTPCGSSTTFVPSHRALLENSEQSSAMSESLNCGVDVTVRHAWRISIFLSLAAVCGNADPSHMTDDSVLRKTGVLSGANGDEPDDVICDRNSAFVFGHSSDSPPISVSEPESRGVLKSGSEDWDDDDVVELAGERPAMLLT